MWLGEQITERGIGNGMSLIIFAGIVVGLRARSARRSTSSAPGRSACSASLFLVVMMVLVVGAIIFVERGHGVSRCSTPSASSAAGCTAVEHAHPAEGQHRRRDPGDLRLVDSGVSGDACAHVRGRQVGPGGGRSARLGMPLYNLLYIAGIIFFAYFYTAIIFNPDDVAENMRKYGGFIPGIRPGKRTAEYIDTILARHHAGRRAVPGAGRDPAGVPDHRFQGGADSVHRRVARRGAAAVVHQGLGVTFYFGGTSLLIVVGVAMDTVQQVESQLIMRHYDGFMKKTRIRGRRG